jgi:purine-nucleoside phosphorylase
MILEEFDECKTSTFDPNEVENVIPNFPKIGITFFSKKLMDRYIETFKLEKIAEITNANGHEPVYKINYKGTDIALFMSRVGAPACTVGYEEVTVMGIEKLIMFGTCGVLDRNIEDLAIIIPTHAIRDEGTSYHYLKSSREIEVNKKYKKEFEEILKHNNISYVEGKVWTTDAPYRETRDKVLKRKEEGCVCVDMECSAMNAVAEFRNKDLFQFFYAADNLDSNKWDKRSLGNDDRLSEKEKIIYLALELAIKMK